MTTEEQLAQAKAEIERLKAAIRYHRDQRKDDRCWLDDAKLYAETLENREWKPEMLPKDQFLRNCSHYWECQTKGLHYQTPEPDDLRGLAEREQ